MVSVRNLRAQRRLQPVLQGPWWRLRYWQLWRLPLAYATCSHATHQYAAAAAAAAATAIAAATFAATVPPPQAEEDDEGNSGVTAKWNALAAGYPVSFPNAQPSSHCRHPMRGFTLRIVIHSNVLFPPIVTTST